MKKKTFQEKAFSSILPANFFSQKQHLLHLSSPGEKEGERVNGADACVFEINMWHPHAFIYFPLPMYMCLEIDKFIFNTFSFNSSIAVVCAPQ